MFQISPYQYFLLITIIKKCAKWSNIACPCFNEDFFFYHTKIINTVEKWRYQVSMKIHQGKLGSYINPGALRQAQQNIEAGIIIRSGVMDV